MTTEEVREILRMAQLPVSLEKPIGEEEESELGDFVQDEQAESPFDTASLSLRREDIKKALDSLPERERKVIELRFGLLGDQPCTLEEVGRAFGVTRERIRQIENNTLEAARVAARGPGPPRTLLVALSRAGVRRPTPAPAVAARARMGANSRQWGHLNPRLAGVSPSISAPVNGFLQWGQTTSCFSATRPRYHEG